jgi:carnitine O-acetyltransferase
VCLDSGRPEGPVELSRASWHGGVKGEELGNRWWDSCLYALGWFADLVRFRVDKPCQFIVYDNGTAGFMGEHSVMDGKSPFSLAVPLFLN